MGLFSKDAKDSVDYPHGALSCAGHRDETDGCGMTPMNRRGDAINHRHPVTGKRCPGSGMGLGDNGKHGRRWWQS